MRRLYWKEMEKQIKDVSKNKDNSFLSGKYHWKRFLFDYKKFKIYEVNGDWVRTNLCWYYGQGGHGRVHEFIPNSEIWIEKNHGTLKYMSQTIIHEVNEWYKMNELPYFQAHQNSLAEEWIKPQRLRYVMQKMKEKLE